MYCLGRGGVDKVCGFIGRLGGGYRELVGSDFKNIGVVEVLFIE